MPRITIDDFEYNSEDFTEDEAAVFEVIVYAREKLNKIKQELKENRAQRLSLTEQLKIKPK